MLDELELLLKLNMFDDLESLLIVGTCMMS